jgi:hypothetical protein
MVIKEEVKLSSVALYEESQACMDYLHSDLAVPMLLLIATFCCCWGNGGGTKGKANTKF